jgi:8-oxo-dGTP pyrophosphatase MutT (NUDIX family)
MLRVVRSERYTMIKYMDESGENERTTNGDLALRLRAAVSKPLRKWREVYEAFSPTDLETGEQRPRVPEPREDYRRAAVLVPILLAPEGGRLVYTLRNNELPDHAGQVSFPGGVPEPQDGSLLETALREAEEEIDLQPDIVETIGELEELYIPPSKFLVKPFVGLLPGEAEMALAPEEVEEIFSVPLEELMSPESFRKVVRKRDGRRYQVPVFAVAGYEIWGATAAMTAALLARLGWRENTG